MVGEGTKVRRGGRGGEGGHGSRATTTYYFSASYQRSLPSTNATLSTGWLASLATAPFARHCSLPPLRLGEKGGTVNLCFPPPPPSSGDRDSAYDEEITQKVGQKATLIAFSYTDVLLPDDDTDVQISEGTEVRCVLVHSTQGWRGMKVKLLPAGTIKTWKTISSECLGRVVSVASDSGPNSKATMIQRLDEPSSPPVPLPHDESPYSWTPSSSSSSSTSSRSRRGQPALTPNLREGDVLKFELVCGLADEEKLWARDVRMEKFACEWREKGVVASLKLNEGYGFVRTFNR